MSNSADHDTQRDLCKRYGAPFRETPRTLKLGVADNVRTGTKPINGLRHEPHGDTSGWFIWAGERLSADPDFFKPLHVEHLEEWCPGLEKYLGLAPGWRFLTDLDGYEDVWEDAKLLEVD